MKSIGLSVAALLVACSAAYGSTLQVWLEADQVTSGNYEVRIWANIPDAAVNGGLADMAVSVCTPGTVNVTTPVKINMVSQYIRSTTYLSQDWITIRPSAYDQYSADGDLDALELVCGQFYATDVQLLTQGPFLLATETWKMNTNQPAYLSAWVHPGTRHWELDPRYSFQRSMFTDIQMTGVWVGPAASPVATRSPGIKLKNGFDRVNTRSYSENQSLAGFTVDWLTGDQATGGTLDFGDGTSISLSSGLPTYASHYYELPEGVNSRTYTVTTTAANDIGSSTSSTQIVVYRHPLVVARINGELVYDGDTIILMPGTTATISLGESQGYIEDYSIYNLSNSTSLGQMAWTGEASNLYGTLQLLASNSGMDGKSWAEVGAAGMTLTIVPEPASCLLLALGALVLARRRK